MPTTPITVPPAEPALPDRALPSAATASVPLGAGEAAVVVTAITAVTVLAVLERPIPAVPAVLTAIAAAAVLLLLPGRAGRLLAALIGR